ncbi:MAG: alpha/beta fold hydrolase, partial [Candidatus Dormibacteria bacterium]
MAVDVQYAMRGEVCIAYQAVGSGPVDIIFGAGLVSHLDLLWADPRATDFLRALMAMGRLLVFDKPGTGLSDPVVGRPTVEQRVDDYLAVLDAAGSKRAVVIGFSEASVPGFLLAATHPERVEAFACVSGGASLIAGPSSPPGLHERLEHTIWAALNRAARNWGNGHFLMELSPFVRGSALYRRLAPSAERASASPGMARMIIESNRTYDVTDALASVRVPTLVMHHRDELVPVELARFAAERVEGAQYVELPGAEHMLFFDAEPVLSTLERFVGGKPATHAGSNRKLVTILFTEIVNSTAMAACIGDQAWRS